MNLTKGQRYTPKEMDLSSIHVISPYLLTSYNSPRLISLFTVN